MCSDSARIVLTLEIIPKTGDAGGMEIEPPRLGTVGVRQNYLQRRGAARAGPHVYSRWEVWIADTRYIPG
jgi:hypothetical protein